jgi:ADP-ribosylglycohydrolase
MLLGGALGDAIGSAIEFTPWSEIVLRYGPKGLQEPAFRPMNFTDDTQMTLFAAEAVKRHRETGCELLPELRMSIRYWHATQNIELNQYPPDWDTPGWSCIPPGCSNAKLGIFSFLRCSPY